MGFLLDTFYFEILRRDLGEHSTMNVLSYVGGGELLPIVVLYGRTSRGGLIGGGFPCGGCQQFESTYLHHVNLVDTMIAPILPIRQFDQ